ncbi:MULTISPECIES: YggT family protein [unclassified Virgibacillus]|uniref:YggT family protein n=1 Tax=unclassified Virgibacillus TaxID=2620237 RepID=UPI0024DE8420|nr:YggT family protein [Virgibacillus sp. LDC-1]
MFQLFRLLDFVLYVYIFAIIIYIFMSWFPGARESTVGEFLGKIVEPYLEQFRKIIPPLGMIDFSPIVAIIVLQLAKVGVWELYKILVY